VDDLFSNDDPFIFPRFKMERKRWEFDQKMKKEKGSNGLEEAWSIFQ
jgi:hypothetical protein